MARKIIFNLAMSLDGYIADSKGGFDWIKGDGNNSVEVGEHFNFEKFINSIDIILMGKTAFLDCPKQTLTEFKSKTIYVATNENLKTDYSNVIFIKGDIVSPILKIQKDEGKDIWLFGGGILINYFIKADVIDKYIIGIIPIILGKGKRLFLENNPKLKLTLSNYSIYDGIPILTYSRRD